MFSIKIIPNASKTEFAGKTGDGGYRIRIQAPPVEGAANRELVRFLAGVLGVSKAQVTIVRGMTSRKKLVAVEGDQRVLQQRMESMVK
jgi:uncharacterized protein (TIGR00251 family)